MTAPPAYWMALMTMFLKGSPKLACQLWEAFARRYPWRVQTTVWMLNQMLSTGSLADATQRLAHFEKVLPVADFFVLTTRLSPEGPRRRPEIVAFEERLLHFTTRAGTWK